MRLICTLCLVMLYILTYAQDIPILKYTTQQGMGHSVVYSIYQSDDGYLWFSTDNGLTRYDGKYFRNFTGKDGLESNFIFDVTNHDKAMLVCEYGTGIVSYQPGRGFKHINYQNQPLYPLFLISAHNMLWTIDRQRFLYRLKNHSFERLETDSINVFYQMIRLRSGEMIAASQGLFRWNDTLNRLERVRIEGFPLLSQNPFFSVLEINDGRLLVTTQHHLYATSLVDGHSESIMDGNFGDKAKSLLCDHQNNIWVSNLQGELWRLSPDLKKKDRILTGVIINDMHEDNDHNLWLATYGKGAWCIPNLSVHNFTMNGIIPNDLTLDHKTKLPLISSLNFGIYTLNNKKHQYIKKWEGASCINKNGAVTLLSALSGEYVIGDYTKLYYKYNNHLDSVNLKYAPSVLFKSADGIFLAGLRLGLMCISPDFKKKKFITQFANRIVRAIEEDEQGHLLVGTDKGVYIGSQNKWKIIDKTHGLPNSYVNCIVYDSARAGYWIGTNEGVGLLLANHRVIKFTQEIMLKRCNSIIIDRYHNVWGATTNGLLLISPDNKFHLYDQEDGLYSSVNKITYDREGDRIYFLADNNLVMLQAGEFIKQQTNVIPTVVVENIRWNDHSERSYPDEEMISIDNAQGLTFHIARPCFKHKGNWKLEYRINKNKWSVASYPNEFTLHQIPYGIFKVHICLKDQNNLRSSITSITLDHPKPVYLQVWFISIVVFLTLITVILITRHITGKISRKKELTLLSERQKVELEQKALRNMLNPHFMNNALNSIQTFVTLNDQRTTLSYLSKFAKLMRVNLELLEKSTVTLNKEIQNIELYLAFEKLRFDSLTYSIEIGKDVNSEQLRIPSLVIQPFVENAIWHGILHKAAPGHVHVQISQKDKSLYIVVDDNGIGVIESQKQKANQPYEKPSRGLSIIKSRFAIMNKMQNGHLLTVTDKSQQNPPEQGTQIEIILPVVY